MLDLPDLTTWRLPAAIGVLVVLLIAETLWPFFEFAPRGDAARPGRLRHGTVNVAYGVLNGLIIRFGFLAAWIAAMQWSAENQVGALYWTPIPAFTRALAAVLLLDLWTYAWHRLNHVVPFLWRFHRVHHSDREMDVTTANRFHVGEIIASSLLRLPIFVLIGVRPEELALYEVLLFAVVQFHHANIGLPEWLDRILRVVIVTPHLHKVHHSAVIADQQANFSSLFSWWDRLARTLRIAPHLAQIRFGVDDH
ncbi:MAG: sterol desaturase family protein [Gemmatimonadaceae bacterium]|nr:sterol desaturase family protein [Gemmatimonadaceae bacterium]